MAERTARWVGRGLLALGAVLLGVWLWAAVDGITFRAVVGRRLDALVAAVRSRPLVAVAYASREEAAESGLIGRIEIPRIGLSELVLEGSSGRPLQRGVGHVERTAFPGERGNVGLAGHRDTHFSRLKQVRKDDLIRIETPDGAFAYRVESIRIVGPDRIDVLAQKGRPRLTLVTCYPFYWVGPAPRRFVVIARPVDGGRTSSAHERAQVRACVQRLHGGKKGEAASAAIEAPNDAAAAWRTAA